MSPLTLGAIATASGGALLAVIGWGLRDRGARWTELVLQARLRRADDRIAELAEELAVIKGDLAVADRALDEYREAVASFPDRLETAYDAGQGAMLEQLTGLCAAEPWAPVPPPKWARLIEARENLKGN